jgi:hypothetical protein
MLLVSDTTYAYNKKGQGSSYRYFKAKHLGEIMGHRAKKCPGKQWVNFFEVNQTKKIHESTLTCGH